MLHGEFLEGRPPLGFGRSAQKIFDHLERAGLCKRPSANTGQEFRAEIVVGDRDRSC